MIQLSRSVSVISQVAAHRAAREAAYRDGYYGLRVRSVEPGRSYNSRPGWLVTMEAAGQRPAPWTDGDPYLPGLGYRTRTGARVRTRAPAQGMIRGQRVTMPAGLVGTVCGYLGMYRRVRLDERPEGTFIFRPPDLDPLSES